MFKIKEVIDYIEEVKKITKERGLKYYINTFGCQLNENSRNVSRMWISTSRKRSRCRYNCI